MTSVVSRYTSKLANNVITAIIGTIIAIIVPRTLGPSHYGNLHFIRNSFIRIFGVIDLNGSLAHFVYASKNKETQNITFFHTYYCFIVGLIVLTFLSVLVLANGVHVLFPEQQIAYVFLGALLGYFIYLVTNLTNLSDSKEVTVGFEIRKMLVMVMGLLLLLLLYFTDLINLRSVFGYYIFTNFILIIVSTKYLNNKRVYNFRFNKLALPQIKETLKYYYNYSHPLVITSVITLIILYIDRWFLQLIGGSIEQGFFSLAFQVSSICILITGAMSPIYQQSVAKADGQNNLSRIQTLFKKVNLFYFASAGISAFFFFNAKEVLYLFGGNEYSQALIPMKIMMLYPIHQTYGRFTSDTLLSMEKTKMYRNISVFSSFLGLVLVYFLLAPTTYIVPGLELAATGLALKMVIHQLISVNILLFFSCWLIEVPMRKYLLNQVVILIPLFTLCGIARNVIYLIYPEGTGIAGSVIFLIISALVYGSLVLLMIWLFPNLSGLSRQDLNIIFKKVKHW